MVDATGPTAIVTGASRGIGKQAALELARRGLNVVVAARTVDPRRRLPGTIGETVAELEELGVGALAVQADMRSVEDLERLVDTSVAAFGRVDVLVNNAAATATGPGWGASISELTREDWCAQFDVNLHAPFTLTKLVAPHMEAQGGGRIVNVTSGASNPETVIPDGLPEPLAYPASKAALDRFCFAVAPQLLRRGIVMVNLDPGFVRTEIVEMMSAGSLDPSGSVPMSVPAHAIAELATGPDAERYAGRVVAATEFGPAEGSR